MVTSTIYEVGNGKSRQLLHAAVDAIGGRTVNDEYEKFLSMAFGTDVWQTFKRNNMEEFEDVMHSFKKKRNRNISFGNETISFKISCIISEIFEEQTGKKVKDIELPHPFQGNVKFRNDLLRIDFGLFKKLFKQSVNAVNNHLSFVLQDETALGCDTIVMVGELSESLILQDGVRKAFPRVKVVVPNEPDMAVVQGAVILGQSLLESSIHHESRVGRRTKQFMA